MRRIEALPSGTPPPWVINVRFDHDTNGLYNVADDM
jgi:hypothetical protein